MACFWCQAIQSVPSKFHNVHFENTQALFLNCFQCPWPTLSLHRLFFQSLPGDKWTFSEGASATVGDLCARCIYAAAGTPTSAVTPPHTVFLTHVQPKACYVMFISDQSCTLCVVPRIYSCKITWLKVPWVLLVIKEIVPSISNSGVTRKPSQRWKVMMTNKVLWCRKHK